MLCCNICNYKLKPFININKLLNYNYCSNCFHILSTSYTPNTPCQNEINEQLKNIINQLKSQRCIVNLLYIYVKNKPNINFEINYSWSGIMGIGDKKKPILKQLSSNVSCGVRLGGMGVAIGASVGKDLADLVYKS